MDLSGECATCGTWRKRLHRDRVVPGYKGGTYDPSNVQYICANCHQDKTEIEMHDRMKGRVFSAEHRAKISAGLRGRVIRLSTREKLSRAITGKIYGPRSPETKAKISATKRARQAGHIAIFEPM